MSTINVPTRAAGGEEVAMKRFLVGAFALGAVLITSVILNLGMLGGFPWSELPVH